MARPGPQTQAKRRREQEKKDKRKAKEEKKALKKALKKDGVESSPEILSEGETAPLTEKVPESD